MVGGDFNDDPETSPAMAAVLHSEEWVDLRAAVAEEADRPPDATYGQGGAESRLDYLFANQEAKAAFQEFHVAAPEDFDFPGHRPIFASFRWPKTRQEFQQVAHPRAFPRPEGDLSKAEKEERMRQRAELLDQLHAEAASDWQAAMASSDVEALWRIWCTVAETMFLRLAHVLRKNTEMQAETYP